jgi:hypothetical protein
MVGMRKEMIPAPNDDVEHASTGELISRLTRETSALVKAEVARLKLQASSIMAPAVSLGVLAVFAASTFMVGLFAFGVALFVGIQSLTGSAVLGGVVVGAVGFVLAGIAGALAAGVVRTIPHRLKGD